MKSKNEIILRCAIAGVIFFLLAIGLAAVLDFHTDGRWHDDCPLCRFDMNGHMLLFHAAVTIAISLVFHLPVHHTIESVIRTVWIFGIHLPNAPPSSTSPSF